MEDLAPEACMVTHNVYYDKYGWGVRGRAHLVSVQRNSGNPPRNFGKAHQAGSGTCIGPREPRAEL